jgi:hypothetical protein
MMDPTYLFLVRMIERVADVIIGGIAIYLGYSLFLRLPRVKASNGEFVLPGNVSIYLSRIGPGIFFALFGTAVVLLSLYMQVTIDERIAGVYADDTAPISVSISGVTEDADGQTSFAAARAAMRLDMAILNQLPNKLDPDLEERAKRDILLALPRIKLAMMESIWDENEWGDRVLFRQAFESGEIVCPAESTGKAAEFFCYGTEGATQ